MNYNDKYTAKLILRKSGNYMKLSLLIFITMIALLCFSLLFYLSYSNDNNKNYAENEIVHVLSVEGKFDDNTYRNLRPQDKVDLDNYLSKKDYDASTEFFYSLSGVTVNNETSILIIGVDENASHYISDSDLENDVLYTNDFDSADLEIDIPIIHADEDGNMNIDDSIKKTYPIKKAIKNKVIDYFCHDYDNLKKVYVTEETYLEIFKLVNPDKEKISSVYDSENIVIDSAYVNVTDLADVDKIANKLGDEGYDINYTFSAFDAMGTSLQKNGILFFIMIMILLVVASVNLILSMVSYIDMSTKDMGVLKFMGYDSRRIYNIYKRNINRIFLLLAIVAEVCITILTFVTIDQNIGSVILGLSIGVISLLLILDLIINEFYLKKVTKNNLLYLIKETKQFE
ncbi:MAG: hypothetical protein UH963_13490 [Agathobacter sp.]|nr:hypothetical protein [Agathobacter sp.]